MVCICKESHQTQILRNVKLLPNIEPQIAWQMTARWRAQAVLGSPSKCEASFWRQQGVSSTAVFYQSEGNKSNFSGLLLLRIPQTWRHNLVLVLIRLLMWSFWLTKTFILQMILIIATASTNHQVNDNTLFNVIYKKKIIQICGRTAEI